MIHHRPPMDDQRVLTIAAFDALVEVTLSRTAEPLPGATARRLLEHLSTSGLAEVASTADSLTMRLLGVSATANGGSTLTLLRNWQSAARDAVAQGARR